MAQSRISPNWREILSAQSTITGNQEYLKSTSGALNVTGTITVGGTTDNSAFTASTSTGTTAFGFYHSTIDTVTDGRAAAIAIDSKRNQLVAGPTASGSSITAAPLTIGGRAATALPTAVTDGQVVNAMFTKSGKIVAVGRLRENLVNQQTTITSSTAETTIVTADATYKLDLYGLVLANSSTTGTKVTIKDSTAGTTRFVFYVPGSETRGIALPVDSAHKQNAANNNWTATCGTSVASLDVTALCIQEL